ncbi:MAG: amino acid ABC transporter substrate-binding protein [Anaerolineales bacterium]|nr:amino acid ABC transporter substrate-binding protein [Anaerolineae bacterium]PWB69145.1 MAG: amino acid ABC transporter substrate-binding protein [Anaerolineales bacterium]
MRKLFAITGILIVAGLVLAACGGAAPAPSGGGETVTVKETVIVTVEVPAESAVVAPSGYGVTLQTVLDRGNLICGVNAQVPGFGYVGADGSFAGIDVDYCRALAAAIFGDATKVEFRPVTAAERFTALQSGEIDVLSRNTTWSLVRDTELGGNFVHTTFYDGQGMMVPAETGFTTLQDLDGGTICVQTGTTTELNLADVMAALGVSYTPAVFEDADSTFAAYAEGRCDAVTTDKSGLVSRRSVLPDPSAHVIMDVTMSKEPLGPMVRHGDDQWFDIAQWTVFTLFSGEEFGITSANVDDVKASATNPEVRRMLGLEGDLGLKLGLSNDWAYNIIKQVGNYEEVYNRNLGPDTPTYIPRGLNSLYTNGGLLYSPPFR